jgi:uncharacterized protein YegP (UPF0339 family)
MAAKFEIYKDTKGEFRWRLKSANGQTIATGGEGCVQERLRKRHRRR